MATADSDRGTARRALFDHIEGWYNPHRGHSALQYCSPAEFVKRWEERGEAYFESYRAETYEFSYAYEFDRIQGRRTLTAEALAALHAGTVGDYEE